MVASFATITHSRPETRPMPQMIEAECTSPLYMPQAASWPISRNGEPASSSVRTRSRGSSLPRAACLSRAAWSPPMVTVATFSLRSATSERMRSALARNSAERGLIWLRITVMVGRSSLLERPADHHALDVARTFVDLRHAHVAPQALHGKVGDVAVAAVNLNGVRAHALGHLGGKELRHRRLADAGLAAAAQPGGMQIELARGFDLRRHVGEAEIDRLVFDQRLAHAFALFRIRQRRFQRAARHAGRLGGDVNAAGFEVGE